MDILGFLTAFGALVFGRQVGIDRAVFAALGEARERAGEMWTRLRIHYDLILARHSVRLLIISTIIEILMLVGLRIVLGAEFGGDLGRPTFWLVLVCVLLAAKMGYAFYMWSAMPRYLMEDGLPRRHPGFWQNAAGQFTAANERVLTYEEDVYGSLLPAGQAGTPLRLNNLGRVFRYYEQNGRTIDAHTAQPLMYVTGQPKRFNPRGLALRYYQHGATWFDGLTGTQLPAAPPNPEETIPNDQINREELLNGDDRRVRHDLAGLPMLDPAHETNLHRHSFVGAAILTVASALATGLCIVWWGMMNGIQETLVLGDSTYTFVIGDHLWIIIVGGVYFMLTLALVHAVAWVLTGVYAKTVQLMEFVTGIVIEQGLVILPGITMENIASRFTGARHFIDEVKHQQFILGRLLEARLSFILWFIPVLIIPDTKFATLVATLMFLQGLANHLLWERKGQQEVTESKYNWARLYKQWAVRIFLLVGVLLLRIDGLRRSLFARVSDIYGFTHGMIDGRRGIDVPGWWSVIGLLIVSLILLGIFTSIFEDRLKTMAKWVFGVPAVLAGILLIAKIAGYKELRLPKSSAPVSAALLPITPINVEASIGKHGVIIEWLDRSSNERSFRIERHVNGGAWTPVGTTGANEDHWTDRSSALKGGTEYCYRVVAVNQDGEGPSPKTCLELPVIVAVTEEPAKSAPPSKVEAEPAVPTRSAPRQQGSEEPRSRKRSCDAEFVQSYKELHGKAPSCLRIASAG